MGTRLDEAVLREGRVQGLNNKLVANGRRSQALCTATDEGEW